MHEYVLILPDGSEGGSDLVCPGEAEDPTPTPVPPTPGQIFNAFKDVVPPKAELSVQPPGGQTLVNFETIFSTEAEAFSSGVLDLFPGFTIEFLVEPVAYTWNFGDGGDPLTTDWAGEPWSEGADVSTLINHVYNSTDPVKTSVIISWGADVRINGGAPQPVNGTVDVTSDEVPLEILEATPNLVE